MAALRPAAARGVTKLDWLDSKHSFSFGHYMDPAHMGFGPLRVINDDRVAPGGGFGTHGHQDMEIVTYVLDGVLQHRDSLGNGSIIKPGDVQRMSAGTGIMHSEFNASDQEPVHFLQIWIIPERRGVQPSYEQVAVPLRDGAWTLIAARDGRDGAITIGRDVDLYAAKPTPGTSLSFAGRRDRKLWLHVAEGAVEASGQALTAGDGLALTDAADLTVTVPADAAEPGHVLLFDVEA